METWPDYMMDTAPLREKDRRSRRRHKPGPINIDSDLTSLRSKKVLPGPNIAAADALMGVFGYRRVAKKKKKGGKGR